MENDVLYDTGYLIYPGVYVPLLKEEDVKEELKRSHEGAKGLPPVNITELADLFKIEVAIPGVKREDFLLHIDENILSILVYNKEGRPHEGEIFQLHEFNYGCFQRYIILPGNIDSEFIKAEYNTGILRLNVPKATHPANKYGKKLRTSIVVY